MTQRRTRLNPVATRADAPLRRPARNTVTIIGDSIAEWGSQGYQFAPLMGDQYMNHISVETFGRVRFAGQYAVKGGTTLTTIRATLLPMVLATSPLPGACIISGGTNDAGNVDTTFSLPYSAGALKGMVAALDRAGIMPILVTIPPREDGFSVNATAWNTWIKRFAGVNGWPLIDIEGAVTQADGTFIPAYKFNTIHPNTVGHRAVALKAISDGIADIFPPNGGYLTSRSTADLSTMFNNGTLNEGMFTVDTNADGVANGLALTGTATASVVAPTAADDLMGNWQQLQRTTGNTGIAFLNRSVSSGWSVGDVLALSARIQTDNINTTQTPFYVNLQISIPGGYLTPVGSVTTLYHGLLQWTSDVDGLAYVEAPVPAGASTVTFQIQMNAVANAGTPRVRVGEATLRNLTTGGLLV